MTDFDYANDAPPRVTPKRRYFTVAEANCALVLVKRIIADVVTEYARLVEIQEAVEALEPGGPDGQVVHVRGELARTADKIHACLEELDDVGVVLRDWSEGIVDFPSIVDGREVHLCWHAGEQRVAHWHEADNCDAGRMPIETHTERAVTAG